MQPASSSQPTSPPQSHISTNQSHINAVSPRSQRTTASSPRVAMRWQCTSCGTRFVTRSQLCVHKCSHVSSEPDDTRICVWRTTTDIDSTRACGAHDSTRMAWKYGRATKETQPERACRGNPYAWRYGSNAKPQSAAERTLSRGSHAWRYGSGTPWRCERATQHSREWKYGSTHRDTSRTENTECDLRTTSPGDESKSRDEVTDTSQPNTLLSHSDRKSSSTPRVDLFSESRKSVSLIPSASAQQLVSDAREILTRHTARLRQQTDLRCSRCGSAEHATALCTIAARGRWGKMPRCTKCGAIGHNRRSCGREKRPAVRKHYPRRSKSGAPRAPGKYRCGRCGKPGHNRVRCLRLDQQQAWVADRRQRVVCDDIDMRTPFERALSPPFQILRDQRATCVELMRTLVGMVCVEVWCHERSLERDDSHIL